MYLLDTNIFLESAKRYYALDIAPKFWEKLHVLFDSKIISSIQRVKDEIKSDHHGLSTWIKENAKYFSTTASNDSLVTVSKYIESLKTTDAQKSHFLSHADIYISVCSSFQSEFNNCNWWKIQSYFW
jgi:hypothetical protein